MVAAIGAKNCLSRNSCFLWTLFSHERGRKYWITVMLDIGHPGTPQETLQVVSFLVFLPEKHLGCILCTCTRPMTSSPQKWCHIVVGHIPSYIVSNSEANRTDGSWDTAIFVSYPSPWIFPNLTIIRPAPETWPQIQCHNNSLPSLPRLLQTLLPVHWQLGQHQSACPSTTGTPKMHTTPSPYFAIPWRTGSSSTAYCQTARTTLGMFLQP